jgi:DNA transformation protein
MSAEHEQHIIERLSRAAHIRTRRMFGGVGIYAVDAGSADVFFALIANDVVYFKVDDRNRADFEARGMEPFQPFPDKRSMKSYYALPPDVLDDARTLRAWVAKALDAARAKPAKR